MRQTFQLIALVWCLLDTSGSLAQNFGGNKPSTRWRVIKNSAGRIIFPAGLDSQAKRIASLNKQLAATSPTPLGAGIKPWNTILLGETTIPNAYVRMAPVMSEYFMNPSPNSFTLGSIRWDDNLVIHENRHQQQFSQFNSGFTKVFRFLLGEEGQLLANGMQIPDYFFEGDAIWQETYASAQGRGRMPYFFNGLKALWLDNRNYSWMKLRSGSLRQYVPDHYQLGYPLVAYGYEKYGLDFWRKVTQDAVRFRGAFYAFNRAIEKHSGVSYRRFREDALGWMKTQVLPTAKTTSPLLPVTPVRKNDVVDYLFPTVVGNDSIIAVKRSYQHIPHFVLLHGGKETRIHVQNITTDHYFTRAGDRLLYSSLARDGRWANTEYSVIHWINWRTGKQQQVTERSRYYAPVFNPAGTEILAAAYEPTGPSALHRLDASTGQLLHVTPNPNRYLYTQTCYLSEGSVVSAIRLPDGRMTVAEIELQSGETKFLLPPTYRVLGNPLVHGDTIYLNRMDEEADQLFALDRRTGKLFRLNNHPIGVYGVAVAENGDLFSSVFTANGHQLVRLTASEQLWQEVSAAEQEKPLSNFGVASLQQGVGVNLVQHKAVHDSSTVKRYKQTTRLFNFHSARPELADPEFRYSLFGDQVLSGFSSRLTYTYNRSDRSHGIGGGISYAGWMPVLQLAGDMAFNRQLDTAVGKTVQYNTAGISTGAYLPFRWIGRGTTALTLGGSYTWEQLYYRGIGKDIFSNNALQYSTFFVNAFRASQQAVQHINPRWAQSISASFRQAHTFVNSWKFVANSKWYFPGVHRNHSLVLDLSYQRRDTMRDLFSNTFSYARGYLALSTREMQHVGLNYNLPIAYPDWGFGNIAFIQRLRANLFFDFTQARARVQGILQNIDQRSTGVELFVDGKIWNALPASLGIRYSRLLDVDLRSPATINRWEIVLPVNLIPD